MLARSVLVLLALFCGVVNCFTVAPKPVAAVRCSTTTPLFMSTATVEKVGTGPAVLDRPTVKEAPVEERRRMGSEAWEVRIYNDRMNTREHVARALVQVTGMSEMGAYQTMMQAHQNGIAVVGRWVYEIAEMYHDALKKNGIVCDIVPVEEE
ncbi:ATP-dependent Clp protease adaptor protein ClpS [Fistulifera solaris]|uniref:ATP-dependent Clp protease adaptor protein ClpS n=1 Tax=Fistulifera solaris TaxID=1519565 RepID=A0A1Z5KF89_FISSO|nr:ATP-dependent Clp protease adaptor protein ClpS [Fistulifera solaris]|eukprot:GAX24628.1 ATP-dependent Clp protease adaptor protein ClpS [Fistulifera solaris]